MPHHNLRSLLYDLFSPLSAFSYIAFVDAGDPGVGEEVMMYSTVHTLVTQGTGRGEEEEGDVLQFQDVEHVRRYCEVVF